MNRNVRGVASRVMEIAMRAKAIRIIGITAASLIWLTGCDTTGTGLGALNFNGFKGLDAFNMATPADPAAPVTAASLTEPPNATPELLGNDPNDDVSIGKKYFRQGSYGLAEQRFRKAAETHPRDAEAWLGLAASYDRLRRFDLADRAYKEAIRLVGETSAILNNQGFSYMLRGDNARARAKFLAAQAMDPANPFAQNNLVMLDESARKRQSVN
jgi:Flp pilus assembly protein TadD